MRPGITGLWQVEARDNPAFDAYQRLDLFYVENWSLALDIVIMLGTAEQMLLRPFLSRRRRRAGRAGRRRRRWRPPPDRLREPRPEAVEQQPLGRIKLRA